jgi:hypothetical protein
MGYLILIVFSLVSIAGRAADEFRAVPLTPEDVISIYKVPFEERPSYKCEWTLEREKYVRYVLEETDKLTEDWKINGTYHWKVSTAVPCKPPVKIATLIYTIEYRALKSTLDGRNFWRVDVRFGGAGSVVKISMTYSLDLELPETRYTMVQSNQDPSMVFIFQGAVSQGPSKIYRLRLESSDHPFPVKINHPSSGYAT